MDIYLRSLTSNLRGPHPSELSRGVSRRVPATQDAKTNYRRLQGRQAFSLLVENKEAANNRFAYVVYGIRLP